MGAQSDGGRVLLFERLLARLDLPGRPEPFRDHDAAGLRHSIERSLTDLLNTRTPPVPRLGAPSVLDYGLADVASLDAVPDAIARSIAAFEPRLTDVTVLVRARDDRRGSLDVDVAATLIAAAGRPRVAFRLALDDIGTADVG